MPRFIKIFDMQVLQPSNNLLLRARLVGKENIPSLGISNVENVNTIVDVLKYAGPELLYFGLESTNFTADQIIDDELLIQLHILDAQLPTNILNSAAILRWCSRELKRNRERIVIKEDLVISDFKLTKIDIYIRKIVKSVPHSATNTVYQLPKKLDYAV